MSALQRLGGSMRWDERAAPAPVADIRAIQAAIARVIPAPSPSIGQLLYRQTAAIDRALRLRMFYPLPRRKEYPLPKFHENRKDAPAHKEVPSDEPGIVFVDVPTSDAPEYAGADFVLMPRDIVLHADGWHDRRVLRCHEVTDPAVLARKANLGHYFPRREETRPMTDPPFCPGGQPLTRGGDPDRDMTPLEIAAHKRAPKPGGAGTRGPKGQPDPRIEPPPQPRTPPK
jgi:hypothetical protein